MGDPTPTPCSCSYLGGERFENPRCYTHGYRIALRPNRDGDLDDVVVHNVECFRMEQLDSGLWWLACYFEDNEDRLAFHLSSRKPIEGSVTEDVTDDGAEFRFEPGSIGAAS